MLSLLYGPALTSEGDYWKTVGLTRRTLVGKVMSLLFHQKIQGSLEERASLGWQYTNEVCSVLCPKSKEVLKQTDTHIHRENPVTRICHDTEASLEFPMTKTAVKSSGI